MHGRWHFAHRYSRRTKDKSCTCAKQYRPWSFLCQDHVGLQGDQLFREMRRHLREGEKTARARRSTLSWKILWSAITQAL